MINVFQPSLGVEELEAIKRVFNSNWIGKGKVTDNFEFAFANHLQVDKKFIRSLNCCSEGIFQSMTLLKIGPGDEVILPSISFVAAANAIASVGAKPVFCDVDIRTLNPSAEFIEEKITARTKAVIILHYGGVSCEMDDICELLNSRGIRLIEDSACSVSSSYKGRACGTFGDIGIWSFDAMKILVTGDGSIIYCNTAEMAQRAEELLYLGLLAKSGLSSGVDTKWWEFDISCFGRRAIMNDIASAIGVEQLKKLPGFIDSRKDIHEYYDRALTQLHWLRLPPKIPSYSRSSYYFYWIQMQPDLRDRLARYLREKKIYTTFRYYPLHWVKFYGVETKLPNAEDAAQSTLCIPIHQSLSRNDLDYIVGCIHDFSKEI